MTFFSSALAKSNWKKDLASADGHPAGHPGPETTRERLMMSYTSSMLILIPVTFMAFLRHTNSTHLPQRVQRLWSTAMPPAPSTAFSGQCRHAAATPGAEGFRMDEVWFHALRVRGRTPATALARGQPFSETRRSVCRGHRALSICLF